MKRMKQVAVALAALLMMASCSKMKGEGPVVTELRDVTGFSGLVIKIPAKTIFVQGTEYKVELQAQRNILDEITTAKSGTDLVIRFDRNINIRSMDEPVLKVTMPFIDKAEIHGSGSFFSDAPVNAQVIDLLINGSGSMEFSNLVATDVLSKINGSGNIRIKAGTSDEQHLEISGSGDLEVSDLSSRKAQVHISGSGRVFVNATEELKVEISGSGKVKYKGNPVITSNVSGSGSVGRM